MRYEMFEADENLIDINKISVDKMENKIKNMKRKSKIRNLNMNSDLETRKEIYE